MYGLGLVLQLFQNPGDKQLEEERRHKSLTIMLDACVPDNMREHVMDELKEQESGMWAGIGITLFGRVVGTTWVLGVAFVIHMLTQT